MAKASEDRDARHERATRAREKVEAIGQLIDNARRGKLRAESLDLAHRLAGEAVALLTERG